MIKEILSNRFNININKEGAIPPSVMQKEILSNTFSLNINKVQIQNKPPVITNLEYSLSERNCIINFNIHDEDNDKMNVYLIKNGQEELIFSNQSSGTKTITVYNLETGITTISIRVSDGKSDTYSEDFDVEIEGVVENRPPTITDVKHSVLEKNCTIDFNIHDLDDDKMDVYLIKNGKEELALSKQTSGKKTISVNNLSTGNHIMSLRVSDGKLNTYSENFRVTIEEKEEIVNNPPTISNIKTSKTTALGSYELEFEIRDADNDKMDVYLKIDNSDYEPILINQSNGVKTYKGKGLSAGNHACYIKVSDGKQEVISNSININIPQLSNDNIFESIELITPSTIKANTPTRVAIKLKSKSDISDKIINPIIKNINGIKIHNVQWEKGNILTDWRESVSEISDKTSSLKIGLDKITTKVETIQDDYVTSSQIEQLDKSWTAKFKDGYHEGVTSIDKDGITVTANNVKSKTTMSANGFKITKTDTNEDVFKVNSDGKLIMTGDIQGSTFSSTSGDFKVLDDGTVDATTLNADDEISTNTLNVEYISNTKYQAVIDRNYEVHINQWYDVESEGLEHDGHYKSLSSFIDACPRNLNGYNITVSIWSDLTESVNFNMFNNGVLTINLNGHTIYGYIVCNNHSMRYRIYGNKSSSTGTTTVGSIMPNTGFSATGGYYSLMGSYTHLTVYDMKLYGGKASGNNNGLCITNLSKCYANNVQFIGCYSGIRSYSVSNTYVSSSSGLTTNVAFYAGSGSTIALNNTNQAGRSGSTAHTGSANNGQVLSTGATFSSSAVSGSNTTTSTPVVTKTATITANYGDTYRKTVYKSWKKDGSVRQGEWSNYGDCVGAWFFGEKISSYKDKNITGVSITIKRQAGGSSSAVTHTLKMHDYEIRPSGSPSFRSDFSKDFSVATNKSTTINLTSAEITAFKKCKGLGLVPKAYNSTYYSVCSGSISVKITYKE